MDAQPHAPAAAVAAYLTALGAIHMVAPRLAPARLTSEAETGA